MKERVNEWTKECMKEQDQEIVETFLLIRIITLLEEQWELTGHGMGRRGRTGTWE